MFKALNAKTRAERRLAGSEAQRVADGVWLVRGGLPRTMNVYLVEDDDGVTVFDAGIKSMPRAILAAAAPLGGVKRIVLGHGHTDHRGAAPGIGAHVACHPDAVADAEGSGGRDYWDMSKLPPGPRQIHPILHEKVWDGGPVEVAQTVSEGDDIAGFRVIDLPGHAPGQIGLWRESDRLALVSDCFYTVDMFGRHVAPQVPAEAYNFDTEQARASIRKLADLEPAAAWAGHAQPVTGDVREQLHRAAAT
jgi:glyoxylase-like metal-dependent hydrolase (beta-lactamase superfamily II)